MIIIISFSILLIIVGVLVMFLVSKICREANFHLLWKGDLEKYLAYLDKLAMELIFVGVMLILGSVWRGD